MDENKTNLPAETKKGSIKKSIETWDNRVGRRKTCKRKSSQNAAFVSKGNTGFYNLSKINRCTKKGTDSVYLSSEFIM